MSTEVSCSPVACAIFSLSLFDLRLTTVFQRVENNLFIMSFILQEKNKLEKFAHNGLFSTNVNNKMCYVQLKWLNLQWTFSYL